MPLPKLSKAGSISYVSGKLRFPCSLFEDFRVRPFQTSSSDSLAFYSFALRKLHKRSAVPNLHRFPTDTDDSQSFPLAQQTAYREYRSTRQLSQFRTGKAYHRSAIGPTGQPSRQSDQFAAET